MINPSIERADPAHSLKRSVLHEWFWLIRDTFHRGPRRAFRSRQSYGAIARSGLFDAGFYNTQVHASGVSEARLLRHYMVQGFRQNFDPAPAFSTAKYLDFYPDVRASDVDPLSHFVLHGANEHRIALPSSAYSGSVNPLGHLAIEDRERHAWRRADRPMIKEEELGPYDLRPDDDVPTEGVAGAAFMAKFRLLSSSPDFEGAVAELNGFSRTRDEASSEPEISVIIPVYGELAYTLNALHALLTHSSRRSFEIVIGDDASPDESAIWLPRVAGIRYLRHADNKGFIANCNATAQTARGRLLVFLNNDTRVVVGWLDALRDSFETFPNAGLVGSKIFYPEGRLQEAGGIVWKDGSAWNYGRDDDPNRPRYCYARRVDYVSGCSIAVPAKVWHDMGGFDSQFAPAYYEDADLAFRLRNAGYETWFQPVSRVIHYEGRTSGTDTTAGVKAHQVRNQVLFEERWRHVLAHHRNNGDHPWLERERGVTRRALVIDATNPTPWLDAGSQAVTNLFRYYQALDFQVSFVPENFLYERRAVKEMQALGVQCFYAPYETFLPSLLQKYGGSFDTVHVIRGDVAHKTFELIRDLAPDAQAIFQTCDLHFLRMERQAEVEHSAALAVEAAAMKARELKVVQNYDLTVTHSIAEKALLDRELPGQNVVVMPLIERLVEGEAPFDERCDFMFLGGYGHPPNVDAVHWILSEIWPDLSAACPRARLLLVGANPPSEILASAGERVIVTGLVDDLAPWFARTRAFLAALRYGAGSKGKVLSSLAHGVPVVATDIAAEGMLVEDGKSIFRANTAAEIVSRAAIIYRLSEREWQLNSNQGRDYIRRHHSFESNVDTLGKILKSQTQGASVVEVTNFPDEAGLPYQRRSFELYTSDHMAAMLGDTSGGKSRGVAVKVRFHNGPPDLVDIGFGSNCEIEFAFAENFASDERRDFFLNRAMACSPMFVIARQQAPHFSGRTRLWVDDFAADWGLAFCGQGVSSVLLPDPTFLETAGYSYLRAPNVAFPPWSERENKLFWRGASTGVRNMLRVPSWRDLPRFRLCMLAQAQNKPDIYDVAISDLVQIWEDAERSEILQSGLLGDNVPLQDFARYRYSIDIDGNTSSWPGLFTKLLMANTTIKPDSYNGYRQWYYDRLVPWKNFVPLSENMAELPQVMDELLAHPERAEAIAEAGRVLTESMTYGAELRVAVATILRTVQS